ncbi:MAG: hypothetical protein LBL82_00850 [Oscillospiraceae bacterium]|jgi:hypothetical protein|nr:hypothetical protein [Oscillospiraceae bacterium]
MRDRCLLVKATERKYAESLIAGEVYMRPLSSFWSIFNKDDSSVQNAFRGDNLEGLGALFMSNSDFGSCSIPNTIRSFIETALPPNATLVGLQDAAIGSEKIYSLYSLLYDETEKSFVRPDPRLREFGDYSVIILDSFSFIAKILIALFHKFGDRSKSYDTQPFWFAYRELDYSIDIDSPYDSITDEFTKDRRYSWQNEFRIALDLSPHEAAYSDEVSDFAILTGAPPRRTDKWIDSPLTLQIGDISDICLLVPTDELVIPKQFDKLQSRLPTPKEIETTQLFARKPKITAYRPVAKFD